MKSKFSLFLATIIFAVFSLSAQPKPERKNKSGYSTAKHGKPKKFHRNNDGTNTGRKKKNK